MPMMAELQAGCKDSRDICSIQVLTGPAYLKVMAGKDIQGIKDHKIIDLLSLDFGITGGSR